MMSPQSKVRTVIAQAEAVTSSCQEPLQVHPQRVWTCLSPVQQRQTFQALVLVCHNILQHHCSPREREVNDE